MEQIIPQTKIQMVFPILHYLGMPLVLIIVLTQHTPINHLAKHLIKVHIVEHKRIGLIVALTLFLQLKQRVTGLDALLQYITIVQIVKHLVVMTLFGLLNLPVLHLVIFGLILLIGLTLLFGLSLGLNILHQC